jgi:hypothetical protein
MKRYAGLLTALAIFVACLEAEGQSTPDAAKSGSAAAAAPSPGEIAAEAAPREYDKEFRDFTFIWILDQIESRRLALLIDPAGPIVEHRWSTTVTTIPVQDAAAIGRILLAAEDHWGKMNGNGPLTETVPVGEWKVGFHYYPMFDWKVNASLSRGDSKIEIPKSNVKRYGEFLSEAPDRARFFQEKLVATGLPGIPALAAGTAPAKSFSFDDYRFQWTMVKDGDNSLILSVVPTADELWFRRFGLSLLFKEKDAYEIGCGLFEAESRWKRLAAAGIAATEKVKSGEYEIAYVHDPAGKGGPSSVGVHGPGQGANFWPADVKLYGPPLLQIKRRIAWFKTKIAAMGLKSAADTQREIDAVGGFSFKVPDGWSATPAADGGLRTVVGPKSADAAPMIYFVAGLASGTLEDMVRETMLQWGAEPRRVTAQAEFTTTAGLGGRRLAIEDRSEPDAPTRIIIYHFVDGPKRYGVAGTAPLSAGDRFDRAFDECARSFRVEKR